MTVDREALAALMSAAERSRVDRRMFRVDLDADPVELLADVIDQAGLELVPAVRPEAENLDAPALLAVPSPGELVTHALGTLAAIDEALTPDAQRRAAPDLPLLQLMSTTALARVQAASVIFAAGSADAPPAEVDPPAPAPRFLGE